MRTPIHFVAALLMLCSSMTAMAEDDIVVTRSGIGEGGGVYAGISLGSADYDLAGDSSPSFSIFGGMALNELLAVELGISDFGDVGVAPDTTEASAFHGSVVGNIGLSNEVTGFGQVGLASWDYDFDSGNDSSVDVFWGVGLNYEIGRNMAARFVIQQFMMDANISNVARDDDILNVAFGVLYRF